MPQRALIAAALALTGFPVYAQNRFHDSGQELTVVEGNLSRAVALGDLDGDGDLDALVAQGVGGAMQPNVLWVNDGQAHFQPGPQTVGEGDSTDVALADLDGDGDLDAWIANSLLAGVGGNEIWLNQGGRQGGIQGTFLLGSNVAAGQSYQVALGDLNGDGSPDAITVGEQLRAWQNDGTGGFTPLGVAIPLPGASHAALADLDGDGDLDLVAAGDGLFVPLQVFWNRWDDGGGFEAGPQLRTDAEIRLIVPGQLDSDARIDLWVDTSTGVFIAWNQGGGAFEPGPLLEADLASSAVLGDLDRDGDLDVYFTRRGVNRGGADGYWVNQGDRTFALSLEEVGTGNGFDAALGDLDGDGSLDVFVANSGPNTVWLNESSDPGPPGVLFDSGQVLGGDDTFGVALGDIDGDGDLDAITAGGDWVSRAPPDDPNRIWINQGGAQGGVPAEFADSGQRLGTSRGREIRLADVDLDGDLDIFLVAIGHSTVWINQGGLQGGVAGTFVDSGVRLGQHYAVDAVLGDFDRDGDPDVIIANDYAQTRLFANLGGIQGGLAGTYSTNSVVFGDGTVVLPSTDLVVRDLDADGDLDVFNGTRADLVQWINPGSLTGDWTPTYTVAEATGASLRNQAIDVADLDGDGDEDVFLADFSNHRVAVNTGGLQGGEPGKYDFLPAFYLTDDSSAVALGDLNGDGQPDALVTTSRRTEVWMNTGGAAFRSAQLLGGADNRDVALGDLDGDGDLDAWIARAGADRVWLNGESDRLPNLTYDPELPVRDGGGAELHWWESRNAVLLVELSRPSSQPVTLEVWAEAFIDDLLRDSTNRVTLAPGTTLAALGAFSEQLDGRLGELWNPFLGIGRIEGPESSYDIHVSVLTPGVSLLGPGNVRLTFHNPDFGLRTCFLEGVLRLLRSAGRGAALVLQTLGRAAANGLDLDLDVFRRFRDEVLESTPQGRYLVDLYQHVSPDLLQHASQHPSLAWQALRTLQQWTPAIRSIVEGTSENTMITDEMAGDVRWLLQAFSTTSSDELRQAIARERLALDVDSWNGQPVAELMTRVQEQVTIPAWATRLEVQRDPAGPSLRWWGESGRSYQLQQADAINGPYRPLGPVQFGKRGFLVYPIDPPTEGTTFYQLQSGE